MKRKILLAGILAAIMTCSVSVAAMAETTDADAEVMPISAVEDGEIGDINSDLGDAEEELPADEDADIDTAEDADADVDADADTDAEGADAEGAAAADDDTKGSPDTGVTGAAAVAGAAIVAGGVLILCRKRENK